MVIQRSSRITYSGEAPGGEAAGSIETWDASANNPLNTPACGDGEVRLYVPVAVPEESRLLQAGDGKYDGMLQADDGE